MTKPFPLQPLLDLSKDRLDGATRELGRLIATEQESVRKLELLQNYRDEYEARFRGAMSGGIGVEALRNYSAFIARIDEAIAQQRAQVNQQQNRTSAGKQVWMQHRNQVKAFDTLANRHLTIETRKQAKAEQRLLDEFSSNRFHRRAEEQNDH